MRHIARPQEMGGLPVLGRAAEIWPGDTIEETVWGRTYEVVESPTGDELEILAASAGKSPKKVHFTVKGSGRSFAYHKEVEYGEPRRTTYFWL